MNTLNPQAPLAFIYDRHATQTRAILLLRLERCRTYAENQDWSVAGEWIDTGDDALLDDRRPEFDRLIAKLLGEHRLADRPVVVVVADWDRLSHDRAARAVLSRRVELAGGWIETTAGETSKPRDRHRGLVSAAPGPEADL